MVRLVVTAERQMLWDRKADGVNLSSFLGHGFHSGPQTSYVCRGNLQGATPGQERVWSSSPAINEQYSDFFIPASVQVGKICSDCDKLPTMASSFLTCLKARACSVFSANSCRRLLKRMSILMESLKLSGSLQECKALLPSMAWRRSCSSTIPFRCVSACRTSPSCDPWNRLFLRVHVRITERKMMFAMSMLHNQDRVKLQFFGLAYAAHSNALPGGELHLDGEVRRQPSPLARPMLSCPLWYGC